MFREGLFVVLRVSVVKENVPETSRNVRVFGCTSLLNDTASEMAYWVLPAFLTRLGAGAEQLGLIEGIAESVASFAKLYSGTLADKLARRSMIVKKAKPLAIECIVRGYLSGSGWKEYKKSQTVCGIPLPGGLTESAELPQAIFTPSTKAEAGHDENISFEEACKIVGTDLATQARDLSLKIYNAGRDYARQRGIIIADTKFEFGVFDGKLILIDEVLTPDSSRFWPADQYQAGKGQPSFDKQFVRDYLETLDWDKNPPGPKLPEDVVAKTSAKYLEAYERLTGKKL